MLRIYVMRWWLYQAKGWAVACLILVLFGCQGEPVPGFIVDTWVTDNPQYEECFLKITPDYIIFGDSEKNGNKYYITKVSTAKKDQTVIVTIDYANTEKASFSTELLYSSEDGGHVLLKHQLNVTWKRMKTEVS